MGIRIGTWGIFISCLFIFLVGKPISAEINDSIDLFFKDSPVSSNEIERILNTPHKEIDAQFKISPKLKESVHFWLNIYTQYSSEQVVLFDKKHPEVVYEVMDFHELREKEKDSPVRYEIIRENKIKRKIKAYKKVFKDLARGKKKKHSSIAKKIKLALKKTKHKHSFHFWRKQLGSQTGQKDHIARGLVRLDKHYDRIQSIFDAVGVPNEMIMLSLLESSFNPKAKSRVGATGVWQFMPAVGKEFMKVYPHKGYDERLSPLKAALGAALLLKRNYKVTGHWGYAVTAYNTGSRWIRKALKKTKLISPGDLLQPCQKKRSVGYASRNYYPEFLALLRATEYRELFFPRIIKTKPHLFLAYDRLKISQSLKTISRNLHIPINTLAKINPDIVQIDQKLPVGYRIALPSDRDDLTALFKRKSLKIAFKTISEKNS